MPNAAVTTLLERLPGARPMRDGWLARCPAHADQTPSLSIGEGNGGRALVKCFAGCSTESVVDAMGITLSDIMPPKDARPDRRVSATYRYCDESGAHLYDVLRFEPKDFRQRRADGEWSLKGVRRVAYRLSQLAEEVFVAEGEKDADALAKRGLPATCNSSGAGHWTKDHATQLVNVGVKRVNVLPDNDDPGRAHAQDVARTCTAVGIEARIVELPGLPSKGDVSDWMDAGGTKSDLLALAAAAPIWKAPAIVSDVLPTDHSDRVHTFRVLDDLELASRPNPLQRWRGRLQADAVALVVGQTETWKTFVALGHALSSITGRPYLGAEVIQQPHQIYVAAEGSAGLNRRINAWKLEAGHAVTDRLGIQVVDGAVNLFSSSEVEAFIDTVVAPVAPVDVTIDTVARCSVGADENSARDMGMVLHNAYRIRDAAKGSVTLLHHTNANETRERGSTALKFGVDNMLLLTKTDDVVTMTSAKNKDMDGFDPVALKLTAVSGSDSCVVRLATAVFNTGELTAAQLRVLNTLWNTFGGDGATMVEIQEAIPDMKRRTCYSARKALIDAGYINARGPRLIPQRRP